MRALVSGGAGFLGSTLVDALLHEGMEVEVLDDLSQGRLENLEHARLHGERFRFHRGSVLHGARVEALVARADLVFHLASVVGMRRVLAASKRCLVVNAGGSFRVLQSCARRGVRCILFSSSDVYGDGGEALLSENRPPRPGRRGAARWYYAVAKLCAERAARVLHRRTGLPVTVVRPFNAAGPRQDPASGMVVPAFVSCALEGRPLPVCGTGLQRRTFVAASDLVRQVMALARDPAAVGLTVNVGGREECSILELALLVKRVLSSPVPVARLSYEEAFGEGYTDIPCRRPDLRLLERLGHLGPLRPLREVIEETAAYLEGSLLGAGSD